MTCFADVQQPDWERQVSKITEAEKQHAKNVRLTQLIKDIVASYPHPLQQLTIKYPVQQRPKTYSEEEDRFIVCALARHGVGSDDVYDRIKREVLDWPDFRFNWFIKSRTPIEIGRRCITLISLIQKEHAPEEARKDPARKGKASRANAKDGDAASDAGQGSTLSVKRESNGDGISDEDSVAPPAKKRKSITTKSATTKGTTRKSKS